MNEPAESRTGVISIPLVVPVWRRTLGIVGTGAAVALSVYVFSTLTTFVVVFIILKFGLILVLPIVFIFYEIGVYAYTFSAEGIAIRFVYGRTKKILPENIVRMTLDDEYRKDLVVHWKKSRRHSTRIFKISGKLLRPIGLTASELLDALTRLYGDKPISGPSGG